MEILLTQLLSSDLFKSISEIFAASILLAVFVSITLEAIKNSIVNIFNYKDKKVLIWIINIVLSIVLSVVFLFSIYFEKNPSFSILGKISYIFLLSVFNWGLSFLCYVFVIKWFMTLMEIVNNILAKLRLNSEKNTIDAKSEIAKAQDLFVEIMKTKKTEELDKKE